MKSKNSNDILKIAKEVFEIEAKEISNLSNLLTSDFENAVKAIFNCKGKLIISGMGKSGIVGQKIAATLASTGTPSFFLHPGEAYHGDLGMIESKDIIILISNSGETDEILKIIPFLKHQKIKIISMSGNTNSTLTKNSDFNLDISVKIEACPLQLAPTSSTTASMVMGDAIAVSLMKIRNFKKINFARFHPGGSLGKKLLMSISQIMKKDSLPIVVSCESIKNVVHKLSYGKCGIVVVVENEKILGVITDGDLRRAMDSYEDNFFTLKANDIMTINPHLISDSDNLKLASEIMIRNKISSLVVVNQEKKFVGIVQSHDLAF